MKDPQEVPDQPVAWMSEDGQRTVTAATKAANDIGAGASAMCTYSVPLFTRPTPAAADATVDGLMERAKRYRWAAEGESAEGAERVLRAYAQLVAASPAAAAPIRSLDEFFAEAERTGFTAEQLAAGLRERAAVPTDREFWLIERGTNERQSPTAWWWRRTVGFGDVWVASVHEACQFHSKEAAEAVARANRVTAPYAITRHSFLAASPVAPVGAPTLSDEQIVKIAVQTFGKYAYEARSLFIQYANELLSVRQGCELATAPRTQSAPPAPCESEAPPPRTDDSAPQEQWLDRYPTYCACQLCLAAQSRL